MMSSFYRWSKPHPYSEAAVLVQCTIPLQVLFCPEDYRVKHAEGITMRNEAGYPIYTINIIYCINIYHACSITMTTCSIMMTTFVFDSDDSQKII